MTTGKNLKKLVRAHAKKTGKSYTAALLDFGPASPEHQQVVDLLGDFLFREHVRWVRGLDLRRRLPGADREAKRALLLGLSSDLIWHHGTFLEDSYSLTPKGVLCSSHADSLRVLARKLHRFIAATYQQNPDFSSFSWSDVRTAMSAMGTELADEDVETVRFALYCLGAWGGSSDKWSRPLPDRLEDILDTDDTDALFLLVHEELLRQQGLAKLLDHRNEVAHTMNEQDLALQARELFEAWFAKPYREGRAAPVGPRHGTMEERRLALLPHEYLMRRGLTVHAGSPTIFRISDKGKDLAYRPHEVEQVLGLAPPPSTKTSRSAAPPSTVVNNFHAPVGAVATGPGASAHGTVNVSAVDAALRKVIERQDDLGDLADKLIPLLRAVRRIESVEPASNLEQVLKEAEEFKAFQLAVRPGLAPEAVAAAKSVFELLPALQSVLGLFR